MTARRCSVCGINYPNLDKHLECAGCGGETDQSRSWHPHNDWKQRAADAYYRRHEAEREGPSPDEIGRQEARDMIALERQLAL